LAEQVRAGDAGEEKNMRFSLRHKTVLFGAASAMALASGLTATAQEEGEPEAREATRTMNTITVTTQKQAESLQDVPIAVSAFDPDALDRLNINTGQDLQFNIPNFQSTQGNFSAGGIGIRGIQNAAVGASSDSAVGTHVNGVPSSGSTLLETEFFDVERIEILRGPQGTLYGRNATGGVINAITAKPNGDAFSGNVELTYGEYNTQKATGHVNIPLSDDVGLRLAGYLLKRDGYSEALLPGGRKEDADGRDLWSVRGTVGGDLGERASAFVMFQYYTEDSSRTRSTKQLCNKDLRPFPFNQGCVPYEMDPNNPLAYALDGNGNPISIQPGFGTVDTSGTLGGVLGANLGLFNGFGTDSNAGATTSRDLREFETNLIPEFEAETKTIQAELAYDVTDSLTATVLGSFTTQERAFRDDYNKGLGTVKFNVTPLTPDIDGDGDGDWVGGAALGYNTPIATGLREPADTLLATDLASTQSDVYTMEGRLSSDFDSPFNFTLGGLKLYTESDTDYYVFFNTAEILGFATGLPADRTYFRSHTLYNLDATAAFGEAYWNATDDLKFTVGLRYTKDKKEQPDTPSLLLAPGTTAPGVLNGDFEAGPVQRAEFEEVTGRAGFDWKLGNMGPIDDTLLYGFYSRGYKGGGINPPLSTELQNAGIKTAFDPEFINAFEVGTKSTVLGGRGALNLSAFYYDYEGYQISSIVNRTSVNENVDAKLLGFEGEFYAELFDGFRIDTTIGLLDSEISDNGLFLDTYDQTGGDPNWIVAKNAASTQNCIVNAAQAAALAASPFAATAGLLCNGPTAVADTIFGIIDDPTTTADDAANAAFAASLQPETRVGNPVSIEGNKLPRAPDFTWSLGAQYTFGIGGDWETTIRGDYYIQSEMFTRIFNLEADRIDSWSNANASVAFDSESLGLSIELYGKNLLEDDQITNQYLTDASSGLFTNTFLLEPRQFGIKVGKSW